MTKSKAFSHNGRQLEVRAVEHHTAWVVTIQDETGLTVSTTGSIPRWVAPIAEHASNSRQPATIDALMERLVTDVTGGRLPLLPSF